LDSLRKANTCTPFCGPGWDAMQGCYIWFALYFYQPFPENATAISTLAEVLTLISITLTLLTSLQL